MRFALRLFGCDVLDVYIGPPDDPECEPERYVDQTGFFLGFSNPETVPLVPPPPYTEE